MNASREPNLPIVKKKKKKRLSVCISARTLRSFWLSYSPGQVACHGSLSASRHRTPASSSHPAAFPWPAAGVLGLLQANRTFPRLVVLSFSQEEGKRVFFQAGTPTGHPLSPSQTTAGQHTLVHFAVLIHLPV